MTTIQTTQIPPRVLPPLQVAKLTAKERKKLNEQLKESKKPFERNYPEEIEGLWFDNLIVLRELHMPGSKKRTYECVCSCGIIVQATRGELTSGKITSCGHDKRKRRK
jgi:hypothetical protein